MRVAHQTRFFGAIIVLVAALAWLGWSDWPFPQQQASLDFSTDPAQSGQRRLTLTWPESVREGERAQIRLEIGSGTDGGVGTEATAHLVAEARLDLPGMSATPQETVSQALVSGRPVSFYWTASAAEAGRYSGTLWLHLASVPTDGSAVQRRAISAQPLSIRVVSRPLLPVDIARPLAGLIALAAAGTAALSIKRV